jgi:hypothetical protein
MKTYAVDFETYYSKDYSIVDLGNWGYTHHPEFDAYMVSIVGDDGNSFVGSPKDFDWDCIHGQVWVSHNATFDQAVTLRLQELGVIAGHVAPAEWYDTADLVVYLGLPRSLKNACASLFSLEISKDVRDGMKGKSWESMTPEFRKEVQDYALKDSELCLRIWREHGSKWPEWERKLSTHTREMCWKGLPIDKAGVDEDVRLLELQLWECRKRIPWAEGDDAKVLSPKAMAAECRKHGVEPPKSLAKDSEEFDAWLEEHGSRLPFAAAMGHYRRINTMLQKFRTVQRRTKEDGWMPYSLKYHGAHTGRWSGAEGFNCVTGDHEVLTPDGWVRIDVWDEKLSPIMQWEPTGRLSFVRAGKVSHQHSGTMIVVDNARVRIKATPDHRVVHFNSKDQLAERPARSLVGSRLSRIPTSGVFDECGMERSDAELAFLVALAADGSINQKGRVSFGFKKMRKIERLRALLAEIRCPYSETVSPNGVTHYYVKSADRPEWMTKGFSTWVMDLSHRQALVVLDELQHWDGSTHQNSGATIFYSAEREQAEWVVTLAHLHGLTVSLNLYKHRWDVYFKEAGSQSHITPERDVREVSYCGKVFCPQVPSGMFLVRYHDRIHVTGNCQNLPRDATFFSGGGVIEHPDVIEAAKTAVKKKEALPQGVAGYVDLRKRIVAPEGKLLVVCDLANIEPRVMAVLAGDGPTLNTLRTGVDMYEAHARSTMGYNDPRPLKDVDGELRRLAKARVLGLSYGCGWLKFVTFAKQMLPAKTYEAVFGAPVTAGQIRGFQQNLTKRLRDGRVLTEQFQKMPPKEKAYWVNSEAQVRGYRESNDAVTGLWAMLEELFRKSCGSKEFTLELPSGRVLRYRNPKNHGGLSAETPRMGKLMRVSYHGGVLTENCLSGDTEVLTPRGWIPMNRIKDDDVVWDGAEWVQHDGLVYKGKHPTVDVGGVRATADHKFLGSDGVSWVEAGCINHLDKLTRLHHGYSNKYIRSDVREPEGVVPSRFKRLQKVVVGSLRLWFANNGLSSGSPSGKANILSKAVPTGPRQPETKANYPWDVSAPGVRRVEQYAGPLQQPHPQGLQELRGAWHSSRAGVALVRRVLARYGSFIPSGVGLGPGEQRAGLLSSELPLGIPPNELQEQKEQLGCPMGAPRELAGAGCQDGYPPLHHRLPTATGVELGASAGHSDRRYQPVYDLVNCGPRHQFAVRGGPGMPVLIAHNCCQAVARDVFGDCALRLEAAGFPLILHAHDEAVCLVDEATAEAARTAIEKIMSTPPAWMPTLPQAAEAHVCKVYTK